MKKIIVILISLCALSCAHRPQTVSERVSSQPTPTPQRNLDVPTQIFKKTGMEKVKKDILHYGKLISDIATSTSFFNPQKKGEVAVYYNLLRKAEAEVSFYDPDFTLVKTLKTEGFLESGKHSITWDGKDMEGKVVPDEVYFFTIIACDEKGEKEMYDPTIFSGGKGADITEADINPDTKVITYKLPEMARVLVRLGVHDGALFNTLVDWKPRMGGEITEHWNGKDKDNIIDLLNHSRFKMLITYFTLPENSIITYGNNTLNYREYKSSLETQRPVKEKPTRPEENLSPHYLISRIVDYSPEVNLTFSNIKEYDQGDIPVLQGKTVVKVEIDERDKPLFVHQQYEITLFLDTEFYAEQEVGYTPFNWVWDLTDVNEGEHVLTVNLSGFKDQLGVLSKKVKVVKE